MLSFSAHLRQMQGQSLFPRPRAVVQSNRVPTVAVSSSPLNLSQTQLPRPDVERLESSVLERDRLIKSLQSQILSQTSGSQTANAALRSQQIANSQLQNDSSQLVSDLQLTQQLAEKLNVQNTVLAEENAKLAMQNQNLLRQLTTERLIKLEEIQPDVAVHCTQTEAPFDYLCSLEQKVVVLSSQLEQQVEMNEAFNNIQFSRASQYSDEAFKAKLALKNKDKQIDDLQMKLRHLTTGLSQNDIKQLQNVRIQSEIDKLDAIYEENIALKSELVTQQQNADALAEQLQLFQDQQQQISQLQSENLQTIERFGTVQAECAALRDENRMLKLKEDEYLLTITELNSKLHQCEKLLHVYSNVTNAGSVQQLQASQMFQTQQSNEIKMLNQHILALKAELHESRLQNATRGKQVEQLAQTMLLNEQSLLQTSQIK